MNNYCITYPFHRGVHRNAYVAIPLRRHYPGRMHGGRADGGQLHLTRWSRGQAFVGHLVNARFPRWKPVQRRGRWFIGLVPRQFLPARRVNLRVVVRDVRLDAHGFRCKTHTTSRLRQNMIMQYYPTKYSTDILYYTYV